jgi:ubiquinone/menaquinone biosynthesis C-methylase UbiE
MTQVTGYWNHNVHYQPVVLNAVPAGCRAAIDVGCGDGMLARKLAARCESVTGIDRDARMIALARERARADERTPVGSEISFLQEDFLKYPFKDASFDFACANTALHHMDFAAALAKMARVIQPGGRIAVLGLAKDKPPVDWLIGAAGIPADLYYKLTRGESSSGAPIMEPGMTWAEVRDTARRILPGVRYRRHLLWRYSLVWDKPG